MHLARRFKPGAMTLSTQLSLFPGSVRAVRLTVGERRDCIMRTANRVDSHRQRGERDTDGGSADLHQLVLAAAVGTPAPSAGGDSCRPWVDSCRPRNAPAAIARDRCGHRRTGRVLIPQGDDPPTLATDEPPAKQPDMDDCMVRTSGEILGASVVGRRDLPDRRRIEDLTLRDQSSSRGRQKTSGRRPPYINDALDPRE